MPCIILYFKAVCCSLCPICTAASMVLTLRHTLSTTAGCRICRRKEAWHFMALCKSMFMRMLEFAFLLDPEATCNNTRAGTVNASSISDYCFHWKHQNVAHKNWYGQQQFYKVNFLFSTANSKFSHTAVSATPDACVTLSLCSL